MKKLFMVLLCILLTLSLCACSNSAEPAEAAEITPPPIDEAALEQAAQEAAEPEVEEPEPEALSPYNWLGYPEVPQCQYLDLIASQHYYREYVNYIEFGDSVAGVPYTEAIDDRNTYQMDMNGTATYYVEGIRYSVDEEDKTYSYNDWKSLYDLTPTAAERAAANQNPGKEFQGTGTEAIPLYETVDATEYEYYEYLSPVDDENYTIEKLYLRDGDVFAIYTFAKLGEYETAVAAVTTLITGDIPEGLFEVPDLSGYTEK